MKDLGRVLLGLTLALDSIGVLNTSPGPILIKIFIISRIISALLLAANKYPHENRLFLLVITAANLFMNGIDIENLLTTMPIIAALMLV